MKATWLSALTSASGQRGQVLRWRLAFALVVVTLLATYVANLTVATPSPGSAWGLAYGIGATLFLVGAALYGVRRRAMRLVSRLGLGSARAWLNFHVYGGLIFLLLMLMHSAFRWPTGALTGWLWVLSVWIVITGLVGLFLQSWIPRALTSGLSMEVHYDRIPQLVEEISEQAATLASQSPRAVQALYARIIEPVLRQPRRRLAYFIDITGDIGSELREFDYLRGFLAGEEEQQLNRLEQLFRAKLELDAHYTLQYPLRWWLFLHVPPSLVLGVLVLLHILTVIYY